MPASNVDSCHTVRLPPGIRDELCAATGQPFSTIIRYMCVELVKRERAKRVAATPKAELAEDIASIPSPEGNDFEAAVKEQEL